MTQLIQYQMTKFQTNLLQARVRITNKGARRHHAAEAREAWRYLQRLFKDLAEHKQLARVRELPSLSGPTLVSVLDADRDPLSGAAYGDLT